MAAGSLLCLVGGENQAVVAFDPASGEKRWAVATDNITYQSPLLWQQGDRTLFLAAGNKTVFAVDPKTGTEVLTYEHKGSGGRGCQSMTPLPIGEDRLFLAHKSESSAMIALKQEDGTPGCHELWDNPSIRNSYNIPVYHDGFIYAFSSRILTCADPADGSIRWRSRQPGDGFLTLVDGHLLIQTKKGSIHVAPASPEGYNEIAVFEDLKSLVWAPASFADGSVYVKSMDFLTKIDITTATPLAAHDRKEDGHVSSFEKFLASLEGAEDKTTLIDRFMNEHPQLPLIEGQWAHFIYRGPAKDVALAGDMFGARQEQAMHRVAGTDFFYNSIALKADAKLAYVFVRDYKDVTLDPHNSRQTLSGTYKGADMEFIVSGDGHNMSLMSMPGWHEAKSQTREPQTHGQVKRFDFDSKSLEGKQAVEVYLPAGYDQNDTAYPVAYVYSGEALTRAGWQKTLDNMQGREIKPFIAVFLKDADFFAGPKFLGMVTQELLPRIEKDYRTLSGPENRALIGMGGGGAMALVTCFSLPEQFGKVGAQSPLLFDSVSQPLYGIVDGNEKALPVKVYMDWGTYDLRNPQEAWDMGLAGRHFFNHLKNKQYQVESVEFSDGGDWHSWTHRADRLLISLFGK